MTTTSENTAGFDEHTTRDAEGYEDAFDDLAPGTLIADKYRLGGVLGRGGFAVVYEAEHLGLGRLVALKVLNRQGTSVASLRERFAREARVAALARHPNVLEVYDSGELDDGSPFIAMQKVSGTTLHDHLRDHGVLGIEDTWTLCTELVSALSALARNGIVHRDIKPENLMIGRTAQGKLRLTLVDFGIAFARGERIAQGLTMKGTLVGTPHYMAPEQLRCDVVDARVDIYALGVVLYQALTGRMPYDGPDLSSLTLNVLHGDAPDLRRLRPDCPLSLVRIVERALARMPERRFADAASMALELARCRAQDARARAEKAHGAGLARAGGCSSPECVVGE